ncbi:MAG: hypothetical protein KIS81_12050 [Maricaulaceae bacterium]|nr:hypothetical protein [Maricaulaceae bacterium]
MKLAGMIVQDVWRLLTFRPMGPGVRTHYWAYLAFGLAVTWIVGAGRYWDNPRAELWQHLGLGSVAYVFALSLVLWLLVWPLRPERWSYRNVLLFVTLTAPPALLYAIPVERFMPMADARTANMWFLAVVAVWRVALYWRFLRVTAKLPPAASLTALLLPLTLIVTALTALNLEHAVFNIMAGLSDTGGTSADAAYLVVITLSVISLIGAPIVGLLYLGLIASRWRQARASAAAAASDDGPRQTP